MTNFFINRDIIKQYEEAFAKLDGEVITRTLMQSPYQLSTDNRLINKITYQETPLVIDPAEREEIEDYFNKYLLVGFDLTDTEIKEVRETYVQTFKSMMGNTTFTEWLQSVAPVIKPWFRGMSRTYLYGNDKEGFGHGR